MNRLAISAAKAGDTRRPAPQPSPEAARPERRAPATPGVQFELASTPILPPAVQREAVPSAEDDAAASRRFYLQRLWDARLEDLTDAEREYRYDLLAANCIAAGRGPGADPAPIADFIQRWQIPLQLPLIGPKALLDKVARYSGPSNRPGITYAIGTAVGGAGARAAVEAYADTLGPSSFFNFDPSMAINIGLQLAGRIGPLLNQIQIQNALREAIDETLVPVEDQSRVVEILESAGSPAAVASRMNASRERVRKQWSETLELAKRLESAGLEADTGDLRPPAETPSLGRRILGRLRGLFGSRRSVQRLATIAPDTERTPAQVREAAERGTRGPGGSLPFFDIIQRSFGRHSLRDVQAHVDAPAAEAARAMGARAFAYGDHVAFAEPTPSLRTVAHEAAHVVQQRAGVQVPGGVGRAGDRYEEEADAIADRVVAGQSSEDLLDAGTTARAPERPAEGVRAVQHRRRTQPPAATPAANNDVDIEGAREYAKKLDPFVAELLATIDLSGTIATPQPVYSEGVLKGQETEKHTWAILFRRDPESQGSSLSVEKLSQDSTGVVHAFRLELGTRYRYETVLARSDLGEQDQQTYQIGSRLAHELTHVALNIQAFRRLRRVPTTAHETPALAGFTRFQEAAAGDKEIQEAKSGFTAVLDQYLHLPGVKAKPGESAETGYRFIENELYVKFLIQQNYRLDKDASAFARDYGAVVLDVVADRTGLDERLLQPKYAQVRTALIALVRTVAQRLEEKKLLETLRTPTAAALPSLERKPRATPP